MDAKLKTLSAADAASAEVEALKKQIKEREKALKGIYAQVAVQFADLHDTPGRMEAVGVIRRAVPWKEVSERRRERESMQLSEAAHVSVSQSVNLPNLASPSYIYTYHT